MSSTQPFPRSRKLLTIYWQDTLLALIPHPVRSLLPILGVGEHAQPDRHKFPLSRVRERGQWVSLPDSLGRQGNWLCDGWWSDQPSIAKESSHVDPSPVAATVGPAITPAAARGPRDPGGDPGALEPGVALGRQRDVAQGRQQPAAVGL